VNIDQARRNVKAGNIYDFSSVGGRNTLFDCGNFPARDRNIHYAVDMVGGINDVATF